MSRPDLFATGLCLAAAGSLWLWLAGAFDPAPAPAPPWQYWYAGMVSAAGRG